MRIPRRETLLLDCTYDDIRICLDERVRSDRLWWVATSEMGTLER